MLSLKFFHLNCDVRNVKGYKNVKDDKAATKHISAGVFNGRNSLLKFHALSLYHFGAKILHAALPIDMIFRTKQKQKY